MEIEKKKLQQLVDNFHSVCVMCEELNIYERERMDHDMQDMIAWVEKNFNEIK